MLEATLKVIISAPELTAALLALAGASAGNRGMPAAAPASAPAAVVPAPAAVAPATPAPAQTTAASQPAAASIAAPAPVPVPQPLAAPVPLAAAPAYTIEQLAHAGADLYMRDPAKGQQAQALLAQFGVQAVTQLPKERYGEFATALRGLGANL